MNKYDESPQYLKLVSEVASKTTSITHYCNVMEISVYQHRKRLKDDQKYAKAYQNGINKPCEHAYCAIYEIMDHAIGEKGWSARFEAAKFILERQERLYLSNLYANGYDIKTGTPQERFKNVWNAFNDGLISQSIFKTLVAALKTGGEIVTQESPNQNLTLVFDKDDGEL